MPIAVYDSQFYDGIGYDPNNTAVPPIAERFKAIQEKSFFENSFLILSGLVLVASEFLSSKLNFDDGLKSFLLSGTTGFLDFLDRILQDTACRAEDCKESKRGLLENFINQ